MPKAIDITGRRFGRLIALRPFTKPLNRPILWEFRCDCGAMYLARSEHVQRTRGTVSCGCYRAEDSSRFPRAFIHGMSKTTEWYSWKNMLDRCNDPKKSGYHRYGGRGIKVCERWREFSNFYADMGLKPSPKHSIDRINNDGDYEPTNCKWATSKEQAANKRNPWITRRANARAESSR